MYIITYNIKHVNNYFIAGKEKTPQLPAVGFLGCRDGTSFTSTNKGVPTGVLVYAIGERDRNPTYAYKYRQQCALLAQLGTRESY